MRYLLIADDDEYIRRLVRIALSRFDDIAVIEAADGPSALRLAEERRPDLFVLDILMPGLSGLDCCRTLRSQAAFATTPVIILTASVEEADRRAGFEAGATAYLTKPFSPRELVGLVARYLDNKVPEAPTDKAPQTPPSRDPLAQLFVYAEDLSLSLEEIRAAHRELQRTYLATVDALASALETRDLETAGHCHRVAAITIELALPVGVPPDDLAALQFGAALHDVGKIGVPDAILRKPGPLTREEWTIMRRHPEFGERMLAGIDFLRRSLPVITGHHERWDGQGYPRGLAGPAIPIGARVFAVADALDALLSARPYRPPRSWDEAYEEIVRSSGTHFDPAVVETFRGRADQIRQILTTSPTPATRSD